ncbi:MAG: MDR/zinc-dependent alcohol dehydrogenase-like family protein [Blastocatellia bacterium]
MKAVFFDGDLRLAHGVPVPHIKGEALIRVSCAGICNTDLEIIKGYAGFQGVLGHEFAGTVADCGDRFMIGRRVVGEINAGCGQCSHCAAGDPRHCPDRTVLGIKGRNGAFAEYLSLPTRNLLEIPDWVPDSDAVFIEPLAAACHVLEQVQLSRDSDVAIVGDGKLAQLIAIALTQTRCNVTMLGRHQAKLRLAGLTGASTIEISQDSSEVERVREVLESRGGRGFDVVVEASGSPSGLSFATKIVRARGTIVLKSTTHGATTIEMWPVVVNEINIIGSRCGRFRAAIDLLASQSVDVKPLVTEVVPLEDWARAFELAAHPDSMKVVLSFGNH